MTNRKLISGLQSVEINRFPSKKYSTKIYFAFSNTLVKFGITGSKTNGLIIGLIIFRVLRASKKNKIADQGPVNII
jgi:hypothetical protein